MLPPLFQGQHYSSIDGSKTPLEPGEYEQCEFVDCNFSEHDFSYMKFIDCVFTRCDLSMSKTSETGMQHVEFVDCRLYGIQWSHCSPFLFEAKYEKCLLNFCSFIQKKILKTEFIECNMEEVDFTEADLTGSVFQRCDLIGTIFQHTNLTDVDFETSYGYVLDPEQNTITGARFGLAGITGLLVKYDIIIR